MKEWSCVPYEEKFGAFSLPEGAEALLRGLSIAEQTKYFFTQTIITKVPLEKSSDVKALIVKDGIVIGVMMSDFACAPQPCFIGECICTWDSEDNNGAGYKSRTEYTSLLFLPSQEA